MATLLINFNRLKIGNAFLLRFRISVRFTENTVGAVLIQLGENC